MKSSIELHATGRGASRRAIGPAAAGAAVVLLLLLSSGAASASRTIPPFSGSTQTTTRSLTVAGCGATAALSRAPVWNATSGVGLFGVRSSSTYCRGSIGGVYDESGHANGAYYVQMAFTVPSRRTYSVG